MASAPWVPQIPRAPLLENTVQARLQALSVRCSLWFTGEVMNDSQLPVGRMRCLQKQLWVPLSDHTLPVPGSSNPHHLEPRITPLIPITSLGPLSQSP